MKKRVIITTEQAAVKIAGSALAFQRRQEARGYKVHFTQTAGGH